MVKKVPSYQSKVGPPQRNFYTLQTLQWSHTWDHITHVSLFQQLLLLTQYQLYFYKRRRTNTYLTEGAHSRFGRKEARWRAKMNNSTWQWLYWYHPPSAFFLLFSISFIYTQHNFWKSGRMHNSRHSDHQNIGFYAWRTHHGKRGVVCTYCTSLYLAKAF